MIEHIQINTLTPHVRGLLEASLKWIRRIEDRHETQGSFLDNIDIKPLRQELENCLNPHRITDKSAKLVELAFIEAQPPTP